MCFYILHIEFPRWLSGEEFTCNTGDLGSIPGSGRSPGGGNGHPLQYFCQDKPMDRGAWQATVHGVEESDTTEVTEQGGAVYFKYTMMDFTHASFLRLKFSPRGIINRG